MCHLPGSPLDTHTQVSLRAGRDAAGPGAHQVSRLQKEVGARREPHRLHTQAGARDHLLAGGWDRAKPEPGRSPPEAGSQAALLAVFHTGSPARSGWERSAARPGVSRAQAWPQLRGADRASSSVDGGTRGTEMGTFTTVQCRAAVRGQAPDPAAPGEAAGSREQAAGQRRALSTCGAQRRQAAGQGEAGERAGTQGGTPKPSCAQRSARGPQVEAGGPRMCICHRGPARCCSRLGEPLATAGAPGLCVC